IKYFVTAKGQTQQFANADQNPFSGTSEGLGVLDPAGNNLGNIPNNHFYSRGGTVNLTFDALGLHFSADAILSSISRQRTNWGLIYGDPYEIRGQNSIDNFYTLTASTSVSS